MKYPSKHLCERCGRPQVSFPITKDRSEFICPSKECIKYLIHKRGLSKYPENFLARISEGNQRYIAAAEWTLHQSNKQLFEAYSLSKNLQTKNLIFHGEVGIGKTFLLWAIYKDICMKQPLGNQFPLIITEVEMFEKLKAAMEPTATSQDKEFLNKLKECGFLLLDDLGASEKTSTGDWGRGVLFSLINE